jgi:hypothetical protein
MKRQQVNEENDRNPVTAQKPNPLNPNELAFHKPAGKRRRKKMLKMKDDPEDRDYILHKRIE